MDKLINGTEQHKNVVELASPAARNINYHLLVYITLHYIKQFSTY